VKIGIFDSGLGGLIVAAPIMEQLAEYDFIYLGDAKRVPYGDRSPEEIYEFTLQALRFLFAHDCKLVIVACNTVSAEALHRVQTEFLPQEFPDRQVLGVVIPVVEEAVKVTRNNKIGVIGTTVTVASGVFIQEITKLAPDCQVTQEAATDLVPLIEHEQGKTEAALRNYLEPIIAAGVDTLILGCTHYPMLKVDISRMLPQGITIVSPEEVMLAKLDDDLQRHPEIDHLLSRNGSRTFMLTQTTRGIESLADRLFGQDIELKLVEL
jgi:glutamate racemase